MQTAALVIAIVGAVCGVFTALTLGGLGAFVRDSNAAASSNATIAVILVLGFSSVGVGGGAYARRNPRGGGWMLLLAAVGVFISATLIALLPAFLFLIAAGLAFFSPPREMSPA